MGFENYLSTYLENSNQSGSFNILMFKDKA